MKNLNSLTEEEIIILAQEEDDNAIEFLIVKYKPLVCKIARKFYLQNGDVDDLIQEGTIAFLKAIRMFSAKANCSFGTFAYHCIYNRIIDAVRTRTTDQKKSFSNAVSIESLSEIIPENDDVDPLKIYLQKENINNFYQIASTFSPLRKQVLQLYLDGYAYQEIADMLGVSTKKIDNELLSIKTTIKKSKTRFVL